MRVFKYAAATLAAAALVPAQASAGTHWVTTWGASTQPDSRRTLTDAHHPPGRAHQRRRHEGAPAHLERVRRLRAGRGDNAPAGRQRLRRPPGRHHRGGRARDADAGHVRRAARRARGRGQRRGQRPDPARGGRRREPRGLDLRPGHHAQRELSQRRAPALVHDARGRRRPLRADRRHRVHGDHELVVVPGRGERGDAAIRSAPWSRSATRSPRARTPRRTPTGAGPTSSPRG